MIRQITAAAILTLATAAIPAQAAVEVYTIDKGHSEVSFQIRHLVTQMRGKFNDYKGTINLDPANLERSSVELTIDANSIDTDLEDRDKHLRGEDFFWTEKHPQITFKSKSIKKVDQDTYDVTGTLTMRGVAKEITLPVTYLGSVKDPWGNEKAGRKPKGSERKGGTSNGHKR